MNSDVIRLLPDSVANQIAAGEVIQRPASVVKELVENSVDAGATEITIVIKDAGRTLIQVIDNGCGMSPTDARMAFERHATSKISSAADLYALHTMGFRGEALPSIAAVAQIELRTMRRGDTVGTRLLVSESRFEAQEPVAATPGSNLMVKNIFFHMPARRKFLKKDSVELSNILREFERLALINTHVDFTLIHNDVTLHQFLSGSFKQRIAALFGKNMESQLAPLATETSLVRISGFIGLPRHARRRGYQQFFFVNGRNMRHPVFHKAVMQCYDQLVAPDCQPSYFINFEVDPQTIDVNIHPQKYEIKFEQEQAIFQILQATVRETLGKSQAAGALDFESEDVPDIPLFNPDREAGTPDDGADFGAPGLRPSRTNATQDWEKLYENFSRGRDESYRAASSAPAQPDCGLRPSAVNAGVQAPPLDDGILHPIVENPAPQPVARSLSAGGYIFTIHRGSLMIVSQSRAHLRILYDRILKQLGDGPLESQKLIFPEDIELPPDQAALLKGMSEGVGALGFELQHVGGPNWTIEAAPALLSGITPGEALQDILSELQNGETGGEAFRQSAALAMARGAAIAPSAVLSDAEMDSILAGLFNCATPALTPDGLPVFTVVDMDEIDRRLQ